MNHTPGPLTIKKGAFVNIVCPRGTVCEMTAGYEQTRLHDAQFIIRACNAHEDLVKIAKAYRNHLTACANTQGLVATYHHINDLLATIEKGA